MGDGKLVISGVGSDRIQKVSEPQVCFTQFVLLSEIIHTATCILIVLYALKRCLLSRFVKNN